MSGQVPDMPSGLTSCLDYFLSNVLYFNFMCPVKSLIIIIIIHQSNHKVAFNKVAIVDVGLKGVLIILA